MPTSNTNGRTGRRLAVRLWAALTRPAPTRLVALGYLGYVLAGFACLCLPFAQETEARWIDHLFIAVSAVSTTGLVPIDPGGTYTFFGELVVLLMIQAGGLGYMTFNTLVWTTIRHQPASPFRTRLTRSVFAMPNNVSPRAFIVRVCLFTLAAETLGALVLWFGFARAGVEDALWQAVFHSVSAFCTAGFSLFPTSFEAFQADGLLLGAISALSILGAIGFLVVSEVWDRVLGRLDRLGVSVRIILVMTAALIGAGTVLLVFVEPTIAALAWPERVLNAFFQAMTASTTVGFNSVPISPLALPSVILIYALMLVGASPSGTGGGLKSTTVAIHFAFLRSVLRGRAEVTLRGKAVPDARVRLAIGTVFLAATILLASMFALALTESVPFEPLLFEAISALGTVGLSLGATGSLTDAGKLMICVLMFAGRVGILAFGLVIVGQMRRREAAASDVEDVAL
jgi:trk system potassium uptake protein TrkH